MNALAKYSTDKEHETIYAANLLAKMASQIARADNSATNWDQFEGYIDPTNTNHFPDQTTNAYMFILDKIQEMPDMSTLFMGLNRMQTPITEPDHGWFRSIASHLIPRQRRETSQLDFPESTLRYLDTFSNQSIETETDPVTQDTISQLLLQQLEDEVAKLEQDIPSSIRQAIRKQLTYLFSVSMREHGEHQETVNIRSVRGLYRFLAHSQCISTPSLSLSADGEIYARWRESRNRSIGCMFLTGATVEYGLRNLPKQHGGTSSPAELWSLVVQLGFDDMIRPSAEQEVA